MVTSQGAGITYKEEKYINRTNPEMQQIIELVDQDRNRILKLYSYIFKDIIEKIDI